MNDDVRREAVTASSLRKAIRGDADGRASGAEGYQRLHTLVTGRAASEAELRHVVRERAEAVIDDVARGRVTDPSPLDDLRLHMTLAIDKRDTFAPSANGLDAVDRLTTYANACARLLSMARADKPGAPEPPKSAGYLSGSAEAARLVTEEVAECLRGRLPIGVVGWTAIVSGGATLLAIEARCDKRTLGTERYVQHVARAYDQGHESVRREAVRATCDALVRELTSRAEAGTTKVGVGVGVGYGPVNSRVRHFFTAPMPADEVLLSKPASADYQGSYFVAAGGQAPTFVPPKYDGEDGFFGVNRSTDAIRHTGIRAWLPEASNSVVSPAAMKLKLKQMQADIDAKSKALEADFQRHLYASAESTPVAPSLPPPKRDPYVEHRVVALNDAAFDGDDESSPPESWPEATLRARARLAALRSEETRAREQADRLGAVLAEHGEPGVLKAEMTACAVCGALSPHLDWSDARAAGWRHDTGCDGEGVVTCSDECALSAGDGE